MIENLKEKDIRIAMNWVAHQFCIKARSKIPQETLQSTIFIHGFGADLKMEDGRTVHVEAQIKVEPHIIIRWIRDMMDADAEDHRSAKPK
jgi:hypothetical protein